MCDRLIEKGISSLFVLPILPGGARGPQCEETQAAFVQGRKLGLSLAGLSSSSYDGSQPLLLSSIQMDQRLYFGWAASVLGADADHAGEDDDGNEAAQEKPGGEKGGDLDFFCLTLPLAGTEVCRDPGKQIRIGRELALSAYLHIASVRASVLCSSVF